MSQSAATVDIRFVEESTWGTTPGSPSMQSVNRVSSTISLEKDTYESQRVRTDRNVEDFRHGVRRARGTLNDELSIGGADAFLAAAMGNDWVAGVTYGNTAAVDGGVGSSTITRGTGSWLTDGFREGDIVDIAGLTVGSEDGRAMIIGLTALVMTVDKVLTDDATPDLDITVVGKKVKNGVLKTSFTIEQAFPDLSPPQYQVFTGMRVSGMTLSLPSTGIATVSFDFLGKDASDITGTALDATPAAPPSGSVVAAVNGALFIEGQRVGVLTSAEIRVENGLTAEPVVGQNTVHAIFDGRCRVSGQFTAFFENPDLIQNFYDEDELSLLVRLDAPNGTDFLTINLPRFKFGGANLDVSGEQGLPITMPFQALYSADAGYTIAMQSTSAL
jgi:hypothetical protein